MTNPRKDNSRGGGIFLALSLLLGAGIGIYMGQPSLGILGGLTLGLLIALGQWLIQRGRD